MCHKIPTRPWQSISSELFKLNGIDYLLITDRYCSFFELDKLGSKTSKETIASWNLISQNADCQIQSVDSIRSIGSSLTLVKIRTLLKVSSLSISKRHLDILSPIGNQRPVWRQQSLCYRKLQIQAVIHISQWLINQSINKSINQNLYLCTMTFRAW